MFLFFSSLPLFPFTSLFALVLCDLCIYIMRLMLVWLCFFQISFVSVPTDVVPGNLGREFDSVFHLVL